MSDIASNKSAYFHYEILETFEAGIVLVGTEVKSLKTKGASLDTAFVQIKEHEMWLKECLIPHYTFGNIHNHEEKRERKLLMHSMEILRLASKVKEKGLTLIPLNLYLKKGRVKIKIGLGRGKKLFDKRADMKEKEEKKKLAQALKGAHHK